VQILANEAIKPKDYYSIKVDKTMDILKTEQLSVCVRYCSDHFTVQEKFMGFHGMTSTTADALLERMKLVLKMHKLPFENIVGTCMDEEANMKGIQNGLATKITDLNKKAMYIYCYAHQLNLAIEHACEQIKEVRNAINCAKQVYPNRRSVSKFYMVLVI
jgi:hypothetical protein